MDKAPNYKFVDELLLEHDTCPIEIIDGQFAGIVYKYGKISLTEVENENLAVTMDVTMIKSPDNFDQNTPEFTKTIGEIFVHIVENNMDKADPVDLEDDVHQDKPGQD